MIRRGHGAERRAAARLGLTFSAPAPSYTWYDDPELVVQLSHFAWGAFVVLAVSPHVGPWWPLGVGAVAAAVKEFGVDSWLPVAWGGEGDSWAGSALDFGMYLAGGAAGWLAWYWR